jgi:hypothetical protein
MSAVCCLLSALCSLLSALCSLLAAVYCLLSAVCCLLSALRGERSAPCYFSDASKYYHQCNQLPLSPFQTPKLATLSTLPAVCPCVHQNVLPPTSIFIPHHFFQGNMEVEAYDSTPGTPLLGSRRSSNASISSPGDARGSARFPRLPKGITAIPP